MKQRARPRLWKKGKKKGTVRVPGLDALPFTREQLWEHIIARVPPGGAPCPYCVERENTVITYIYVNTLVLDHHVPLKHGGSWELENLRCVCADCNNIKGSLSHPAFIWMLRDYLPELDARDRKYITACLRTHGQVMRGFGPKKKAEELPAPPAQQRQLVDEF